MTNNIRQMNFNGVKFEDIISQADSDFDLSYGISINDLTKSIENNSQQLIGDGSERDNDIVRFYFELYDFQLEKKLGNLQLILTDSEQILKLENLEDSQFIKGIAQLELTNQCKNLISNDDLYKRLIDSSRFNIFTQYLPDNLFNDSDSRFVVDALEYIRNNSELTSEEHHDIEGLGTPITPRTYQEVRLLVTTYRFETLYDVYNDELSYFNSTSERSIKKQDIEDRIDKYINYVPAGLDLETLYSISKKGGLPSYNSIDGAIDSYMDVNDYDVADSIYENLQDWEIHNDLLNLGIHGTSDFQEKMIAFKNSLSPKINKTESKKVIEDGTSKGVLTK